MLQGLYYNPYDNVLAVYIGPVPKFSKIAFVLVLERLTLGLPLKYKKESTKKLFGENGPFTSETLLLLPRRKGKKIKRTIELLDQQTEVGINFEWAQVAVAQKIKPYTGGEDIKLADEMLEIIQSNMSKNETFGFRCLRTNMTQRSTTMKDVRGSPIGSGIGICCLWDSH